MNHNQNWMQEDSSSAQTPVVDAYNNLRSHGIIYRAIVMIGAASLAFGISETSKDIPYQNAPTHTVVDSPDFSTLYS